MKSESLEVIAFRIMNMFIKEMSSQKNVDRIAQLLELSATLNKSGTLFVGEHG